MRCRFLSLLLRSSFVLAASHGFLPGMSVLGDGPVAQATASTVDSFSTNPPAVFAVHAQLTTNLIRRPRPVQFLTHTNPDGSTPLFQTIRQVFWATNTSFSHFFPESLNNLVWTNFIAHTNGRSTEIWRTRVHAPDWPRTAPAVQWNTNSLVWGLKGLTALSPCWEVEGVSGQIAVTALTRRHGYARGHSMGPNGFHTTFAGKKVWFLTPDDRVVETTVAREVVRTGQNDYTLLLFTADLPNSIQPPRVSSVSILFPRYHDRPGAPTPLFLTEQTGHVSAQVPGFRLDVTKGGDSGSPNLLPLPGELVFFGGRLTSSPSTQMQTDMDDLCRLEGLDPANYQMEWADLSRWPVY